MARRPLWPFLLNKHSVLQVLTPPSESASSVHSLSKFPFPALQLTLSASVFNCCLKCWKLPLLLRGVLIARVQWDLRSLTRN